MCRILPDSRSRFCARSASSSTTLKLAASPLLRNIVPSYANLMAATECDGLSAGRQSVPVGYSLQEVPTVVPRSTSSLAGEEVPAVGGETVNRLSREVFCPLY